MCQDPQFLHLLSIMNLDDLTVVFQTNCSVTVEKLGARCTLHLDRWKATCGGDTFMRIGMTPDWRSESAPAEIAMINPFHEFKSNMERENAYAALLQEELDQRIVVQVHHSAVLLYNPSFVVPKPNGKWRKVLDCRILNFFQKDIHFKMEGPEDIITMAQQNDWATSLDLKNAFNHLRVQKASRPYLAFRFRGKSYMYRAMPFGAKHAPRLFTKALSFAIAFIRRHWSVRLVAYMDDILLLHQDPHYLQIATLQIAIYLQSLGWTISAEKCELTPKQTITFLGWRFDFRSLSLKMTDTMRTALTDMLREWISKAYLGSTVPTRSFASLIGSLSFLRAQLPRASLYLKALHSNLTHGVNSNGWNGSVTLRRTIISELLWWSRCVLWNTPFDFAYRPSLATLTTDASEAGWGAWLQIGNLWWTSSGFFQAHDALFSSNQRETSAVLRALQEYVPSLQALHINSITIQSDNMTTVCNLARQGAAHTLLKMKRAIFSLLLQADIRVKAVHIPGVDNVLADNLSRLNFAGDYELKHEVYLAATTKLKISPTVDCFATIHNRKCPRFFAPAPDQNAQGAAGIDGLAQPWNREVFPYLHPPTALIPQVLQKIRNEKIYAALVVPYWPKHSWWSSILPMIQRSINLGPAEQVLIRGPSMDSRLHKLPPGDLLMCIVSSCQ